ncbi:hypothetical protein ACN28S_65075 [Cystobacter fuscus]
MLQEVFTDTLALLVHHGLVSLETVAQDGTRVRASASAPSFRREEALQACRQQAALHLKAVLAQWDDPELTHRRKAAREAGARDYQRRVDEALGHWSASAPRSSSTTAWRSWWCVGWTR